jgi:hypothetical protein
MIIKFGHITFRKGTTLKEKLSLYRALLLVHFWLNPVSKVFLVPPYMFYKALKVRLNLSIKVLVVMMRVIIKKKRVEVLSRFGRMLLYKVELRNKRIHRKYWENVAELSEKLNVSQHTIRCWLENN